MVEIFDKGVKAFGASLRDGRKIITVDEKKLLQKRKSSGIVLKN